jgi:hypothetical protein
MAFTIKSGSTAPSYQVALKDNFGQSNEKPFDLTNAATVELTVRKSGTTDTPILSLVACSIVGSKADGIVQYDWQASDTDPVGTYDAEFKVTFVDGTDEKIPNTDYFSIVIKEALAA